LSLQAKAVAGGVVGLPMQSGYSHLTVVRCLVNGFTLRVGRRW
jgi:hypothetical protein